MNTQLNIGDVFEDGIIYEINNDIIKIISILQKVVSYTNIKYTGLWHPISIEDIQKCFNKETCIKLNKVWNNLHVCGINKHWIYLVKDVDKYGNPLVYYGDRCIVKISDLNLPTNDESFPVFYTRIIKINENR